MQFNTTIVYYKLLLPSSSFRITSCGQSTICCCQFVIRISSTINFSAVKFQREFILPTYPIHTPWPLYSRPFARILFSRQYKGQGVGDYIYYTQIFDFVNGVAKRGDFEFLVALFVITVVTCSIEYLRLLKIFLTEKILLIIGCSFLRQ